jgi:hypothetical protein
MLRAGPLHGRKPFALFTDGPALIPAIGDLAKVNDVFIRRAIGVPNSITNAG